jgi:hypothetical protein
MLACHHSHPLLETVELTQQHRVYPKQRLRDRLKIGLSLYQFADPHRKAPRRGVADLEPKTAQNPAQTVLDVVQLRLNELARRKHGPQLLRSNRLAMHRPEPAQPHQLRNPPRIVAVALDQHRLERVMHVPGLQ